MSALIVWPRLAASPASLAHLPSPLITAPLLFRSPQCLTPFSQTRSFVARPHRHTSLCTSSARHKSTRTRPTIKSTSPAPAASPAAASRPPASATPSSAYAFTRQLAKRGTPVLLYEAPSHTWFRLGCWTAFIPLVSGPSYEYFQMMRNPPPGIASWVPHTYGVVVVAAGCMGTYLLMGAVDIVQSITALPPKPVPVPSPAPPSGVVTAPSEPLRLQISIKRLLPFMGPKVVEVLASDVSMSPGLAAPAYMPGENEMRMVDSQSRFEREKALDYDKKHLFTAPFRHAKKVFVEAYQGVRRSLGREGFAKINVNGSTYKIDITGGWALENGKALDRLVKIEY